MSTTSITDPEFYLDTLPDEENTDRKERIRKIKIKSEPEYIFPWLNQLRLAPYSYDFLDNRFRRSPRFIVSNLSSPRINSHFLLAFHIHAFENDRFLVGRFCEPINKPVESYLKSLYIEYRIIRNGSESQLWCKVLGFIKRDLNSRMFFWIFTAVNKIMMTRQLKNIRRLSQRLASGKIEKKASDIKKYYIRSGIHWWIFCRRRHCTGLIV